MFVVSEGLEPDERSIVRVSLVAFTLIFLAITYQIKRAAAKRRRLIAEQLAKLLEAQADVNSPKRSPTS